jgi:hypothetical protein
MCICAYVTAGVIGTIVAIPVGIIIWRMRRKRRRQGRSMSTIAPIRHQELRRVLHDEGVEQSPHVAELPKRAITGGVRFGERGAPAQNGGGPSRTRSTDVQPRD